jgi:hypothetical protein
MLFPVNQFTRELQGGPNVLPRQFVFAFHFLEAHSARQAANHQSNGHAGAPNNRFAMADARVNDNSLVHGLILPSLPALTKGDLHPGCPRSDGKPTDARRLLTPAPGVGPGQLRRSSDARAALIRSCVKRQPRGVFTVAGDPEHYKDNRRDLNLSLKEHFLEQVAVYNAAVFENGRRNIAQRGDALSLESSKADLVYMDPPYVPRADDNCYMKRYHFLEGLSCYWEGVTIMEKTRVKKIAKPFTPFSYRKGADEAFSQMFRQFADSILVLSYSSNGYPDLSVLLESMSRYKSSVEVHERAHRYHFGTHQTVERALVQEYLIIGK